MSAILELAGELFGTETAWAVIARHLQIYFFVAVTGFLIFKWIRRYRRYLPLKKLKGPVPHFLLGNLVEIIKLYRKKTLLPHAVYIMERIAGNALLYRKKGMYLFWFGIDPMVAIFKPEAIEAVLSSSTSLDKSWEYAFLHRWLGLGLLTSTGSKWRSRRKILTPSFHFRILEEFIPVFNEQSLVLVRKLQKHMDDPYVDITPLVTLCTLDIVSESVMGVHIGAQDNSESDYVKSIQNLCDYFNHRTARPWLWPDFIFYMSSDGRLFTESLKHIHDFTRQVIKERKLNLLRNLNVAEIEKDVENNFYASGRKRKAFLDLLLDLHIEDQVLSEEDIREEVDTFMFEGHDTTAMGISWALYCIGLYPEVQNKIVEELDSIFTDNEKPISHDHIRKMKYMECVLKESQRIYPSVPLIGRVLDEDITIDGVSIPKQTAVHLSIICLHNNADVFPNPDIFDPDRFLPENATNRHPFAFVPFSAGPRNCIGQKFAMLEEKTVIANLLRHFEILSLDPRDKVHMKVELVLRPAQPLRLKFTPRER